MDLRARLDQLNSKYGFNSAPTQNYNSSYYTSANAAPGKPTAGGFSLSSLGHTLASIPGAVAHGAVNYITSIPNDLRTAQAAIGQVTGHVGEVAARGSAANVKQLQAYEQRVHQQYKSGQISHDQFNKHMATIRQGYQAESQAAQDTAKHYVTPQQFIGSTAKLLTLPLGVEDLAAGVTGAAAKTAAGRGVAAAGSLLKAPVKALANTALVAQPTAQIAGTSAGDAATGNYAGALGNAALLAAPSVGVAALKRYAPAAAAMVKGKMFGQASMADAFTTDAKNGAQALSEHLATNPNDAHDLAQMWGFTLSQPHINGDPAKAAEFLKGHLQQVLGVDTTNAPISDIVKNWRSYRDAALPLQKAQEAGQVWNGLVVSHDITGTIPEVKAAFADAAKTNPEFFSDNLAKNQVLKDALEKMGVQNDALRNRIATKISEATNMNEVNAALDDLKNKAAAHPEGIAPAPKGWMYTYGPKEKAIIPEHGPAGGDAKVINDVLNRPADEVMATNAKTPAPMSQEFVDATTNGKGVPETPVTSRVVPDLPGVSTATPELPAGEVGAKPSTSIPEAGTTSTDGLVGVQKSGRLGKVGDVLTHMGLSPVADTTGKFGQGMRARFGEKIDAIPGLQGKGRELFTQLANTAELKNASDARLLSKGDIRTLLQQSHLDPSAAGQVRKALDEAYVEASLEARGIGPKFIDHLIKNVPGMRQYMNLQFKLKFNYNPFFAGKVVSKSALLAASESGSLSIAGRSSQAAKDFVNQAVGSKQLGEGASDFLGGEKFADANVKSSKMFGLVGNTQTNMAAHMVDKMASRLGKSVEEIQAEGGADLNKLHHAVEMVYGYPKGGYLDSNLAKSLNVVLFPSRFDTKVVMAGAHWFANISPIARVGITADLMKLQDWSNSPEGEKWKKDNSSFLTALDYFTPLHTIESFAKFATDGYHVGDLGELGGMPLGFISVILSGQGVNMGKLGSSPYVVPSTGETMPAPQFHSDKARIQQGFTSFISTTFGWPGKQLGMTGKSDVIQNVVPGLKPAKGDITYDWAKANPGETKTAPVASPVRRPLPSVNFDASSAKAAYLAAHPPKAPKASTRRQKIKTVPKSQQIF